MAEVKESITFDDLADKTIAIDAYNTIYQFITIIKAAGRHAPDGLEGQGNEPPLRALLQDDKPARAQDNARLRLRRHPAALKRRTLEARASSRAEALKEWSKVAARRGMIEEARTHAVASSRITKEIVESAKELLDRHGHACSAGAERGRGAGGEDDPGTGSVYASASQDYDLFLFGSDVAVRNLTITGRRKLPSKNVYIDVIPERIELKKAARQPGDKQEAADLARHADGHRLQRRA